MDGDIFDNAPRVAADIFILIKRCAFKNIWIRMDEVSVRIGALHPPPAVIRHKGNSPQRKFHGKLNYPSQMLHHVTYRRLASSFHDLFMTVRDQSLTLCLHLKYREDGIKIIDIYCIRHPQLVQQNRYYYCLRHDLYLIRANWLSCLFLLTRRHNPG